MNYDAAEQLAGWIHGELGCHASIEESPLRANTYWIVLDEIDPIQIIRSWPDWHSRKVDLYRRVAIAA